MRLLGHCEGSGFCSEVGASGRFGRRASMSGLLFEYCRFVFGGEDTGAPGQKSENLLRGCVADPGEVMVS